MVGATTIFAMVVVAPVDHTYVKGAAPPESTAAIVTLSPAHIGPTGITDIVAAEGQAPYGC